MRTKQPIKTKSPVHLRAKILANGNKSLFLDIYTNGVRTKEYLQLYLIPEKSPIDKVTNSNTLRAAEAICAQRVLDITNGKANISKPKERNGKVLFIDWLLSYAEEKGKKGNVEMQRMMVLIASVLKEYKGPKITMANIDKDFVLGYISFLANEYKSNKTTTIPRPLAKSTQHNYCIYLGCALNEAVRKGLISENPFNKLERSEKVKTPPSKREYLSIDEVKRLIETDCPRPQVKMAYLFSVFCGLRFSDVKALTWGNIKADGNQKKLDFVVKKTKSNLSVPLSCEASKWLPNRDGARDEDLVFNLPAHTNVCVALSKWSEAANIKKHITFHTARHTFATMMLTLGADLYTTSKLLGHANVSTTQIYAKIVDKKKAEAVNLVDGIF